MKVMKKRKGTLFAIFALALALSACSGGAADSAGDATGETGAAGEAYTIYEAASKAMQDSEGYEMDMMTETAMDVNGESTPMQTTAHYIINDPSGNIEMKVTQQMEIEGDNTETNLFVKDKVMYSEVMGMKLKIPMDEAMLAAQTNNIVSFPADAVIDQSVEDKDGGKQVSFTIKGDAMMDYVSKALSSGDGAAADAASGMDISDAKVTAVVGADGKMTDCTTEMSISFEESASEEAISLGMDMKMVMSNIKIGKVTIDFPTDLDSYQNMDEAMAGLEDLAG